MREWASPRAPASEERSDRGVERGCAVRWTGPLESAALLTALPVPARAAASTRGVLPWAPLVGLVVGAVAAGVAVLGDRYVSPLTGAVLGVAALAALTRGLHLDGLADTADGLGPLRDRQRALQVMHQGDAGPFGVVALVLVVMLQVACLAALLTADAGWLAAVAVRSGAVLGVAALAALPRGLHLDGLADTADGLGPLRDRQRALQVMHQGDVGPFGVVALVLVVLLQVACLAALLTADAGWLAAVAA